MLVGENMGKKSATLVIFVIVAVIAICFASLFAAMTGTYSFNFGDDNSTHNGTILNDSDYQHSNYNYNSAPQQHSQQQDTPEEPVDPPQPPVNSSH